MSSHLDIHAVLPLKQVANGYMNWDSRSLITKKGTYVDGHERPDIVEYRQSFLRRMFSLGFLNKDNALTPEAEKYFPKILKSFS